MDLQIDIILRLSSHNTAGMIEIDLSNHNHGSQLRFGVEVEGGSHEVSAHITFARSGSEKHLVHPVHLDTDRIDKRNYFSLIWASNSSFGIYFNSLLVK